MRVAYLLPDPGIPVGGVKGASVHVAEVCRTLAEAGAHVRLLAMRAAGPAPDGVELILSDPARIPTGPAGDAARRRAVEDFMTWAAAELASFGPDLVYERLSLFAGSGGAIAARLGTRRIVEVNAPVAAERARHVGLGLVAAAEAAERSALQDADVVAVSEPMARWSRGRGAATATTLPNGVDTGRFDPALHAAEAAAIRAELGLAQAEVVGFVGSMKRWHGVATLLEAVAILARRRPALRALIVGDGPELASLRLRAAQPDLVGLCHLVGAVPSARVPDYLAALDVAAAPYLDPDTGDGFYFSPLKVVEAMAAARPVVASDFPPIARMLVGAGRLVPAGDAGQLAEALDEFLGNPARARADGIAARARTTAEHDWRSVARSILDLGGAPLGAPAVPAAGHGR